MKKISLIVMLIITMVSCKKETVEPIQLTDKKSLQWVNVDAVSTDSITFTVNGKLIKTFFGVNNPKHYSLVTNDWIYKGDTLLIEVYDSPSTDSLTASNHVIVTNSTLANKVVLFDNYIQLHGLATVIIQ